MNEVGLVGMVVQMGWSNLMMCSACMIRTTSTMPKTNQLLESPTRIVVVGGDLNLLLHVGQVYNFVEIKSMDWCKKTKSGRQLKEFAKWRFGVCWPTFDFCQRFTKDPLWVQKNRLRYALITWTCLLHKNIIWVIVWCWWQKMCFYLFLNCGRCGSSMGILAFFEF